VPPLFGICRGIQEFAVAANVRLDFHADLVAGAALYLVPRRFGKRREDRLRCRRKIHNQREFRAPPETGHLAARLAVEILGEPDCVSSQGRMRKPFVVDRHRGHQPAGNLDVQHT
jgi:hypothetical protein